MNEQQTRMYESAIIEEEERASEFVCVSVLVSVCVCSRQSKCLRILTMACNILNKIKLQQLCTAVIRNWRSDLGDARDALALLRWGSSCEVERRPAALILPSHRSCFPHALYHIASFPFVRGRGKKNVTSKYQRQKTNPVYGRRVNLFVLVCSLSSHRHSYIPLIFSSRFIDS